MLLVFSDYVRTNKIQFLQKVVEVSNRLRIEPNWLMIVMKAESGINPQAQNPITKATGLIQFMPATASNLGTSVSALLQMNNLQQLDYIEKYFQPYAGRLTSVYSLYQAVFFPASLGKPDNWTMQAPNLPASLIANQNKIIDLNRDGRITVAEFKSYVEKHLKASGAKISSGEITKAVSFFLASALPYLLQ